MTSAANVELCLEPLTVLDVDAATAIDIAAKTGIPAISFWGHIPWPNMAVPCRVAGLADAAVVRQKMSDSGLRAVNLEVFELNPTADIVSFRPSLELGAAIGCTGAAVIFGEDPEPERQVDQFIALCLLAAEFSLRINAEFISYRSLSTIQQAADLVMRSNQPNAGITVDLLHLIRSGGGVADIAAINPSLIGHAQVCDGPNQMNPEERLQEAFANRLIPGEGNFPVKAFAESLSSVPLGLEVPYNSPTFSGLTPHERVARLVAGTRRSLQ